VIDHHRLREIRDRRLARTCVVCGVYVYTEPVMIDYMVDDAVWEAAGFTKTDLACLGCFENRLGRAVVETDLTNAVVNRSLRWMIRNGHAPWRSPRLW
jgi:hypothetical protein